MNIREYRTQIIAYGLGLIIVAVVISGTLYIDASKLDTVMLIAGTTVLLIRLLMWFWNPK
jgi:hypothetical protein